MCNTIKLLRHVVQLLLLQLLVQKLGHKEQDNSTDSLFS
jgi:hypothetical protein